MDTIGRKASCGNVLQPAHRQAHTLPLPLAQLTEEPDKETSKNVDLRFEDDR